MDHNNNKGKTLEDVLGTVQKSDLPPFQRRDMTSAIKRICEMAGVAPATVPAEAPALRAMIAKIRPAAHGVSLENLGQSAQPIACGAAACRRHRSHGAGLRHAAPGLGSSGPSHCRRQEAVLWLGRFLQLVRHPRHRPRSR